MICGYTLEALYMVLTDSHKGRSPFTLEEQLELEEPHFCHLTQIVEFLAQHNMMMGTYAQAENAEKGGRLSLSGEDSFQITISTSCPALVGVDSENYQGKLHWVFWDGEYIRDPNPKHPATRPLSDFDGCIYDWFPIIRFDNA